MGLRSEGEIVAGARAMAQAASRILSSSTSQGNAGAQMILMGHHNTRLSGAGERIQENFAVINMCTRGDRTAQPNELPQMSRPMDCGARRGGAAGEIRAVDGISPQVRAMPFGLLGPNGGQDHPSQNAVLARLMFTQRAPSRPTRNPATRACRSGTFRKITFQRLTGVECFGFLRGAGDGFDGEEARTELLERVGWSTSPGAYRRHSKGMPQRLACAGADATAGTPGV